MKERALRALARVRRPGGGALSRGNSSKKADRPAREAAGAAGSARGFQSRSRLSQSARRTRSSGRLRRAFERVETRRESPRRREGPIRRGHVVGRGRSCRIEPERTDCVRSLEPLEKAQAAEAEAIAGLKRREMVNAQNPALVKEEDIDTWRTRVSTARAEVAQARSGVGLAELNLREAFVRAPAAGVIQTRNIQTGQYVQPGAVLATLVAGSRSCSGSRSRSRTRHASEPVCCARFTVRDAARQYTALLTHVAASADSTSRMVAVTAQVDDRERAQLRPGSFAQVTVPVGSTVEAPVIPQVAVRPSERGFLAFVVEGDVAREREVQLGLSTTDGRVEVKSGVKPGEKLVVRGAEALRDGAKVRVTGPTSAAPSPARPGETK